MNNNKNLNSDASRGAKMILFMFELQTSVKMYHWQTESYANHKTTNKLFENISKLIDSFVEKYIGVFGRPSMKIGSSVPVENMTKTKYLRVLKTAQEYFRGPLQKMISKNSELQNIRDELLAEIDQAQYFATLS